MKNLVLIGMPGSGKTTISKKLSEILHMPLIDIDEYIVKKYNQSINDMFSINEEYFRKREAICTQEVAIRSGYIISTGGGVVKKSENIQALQKNGMIFLLDRRVENIIQDIETSHRPLLKDGKERLYELYKQRKMLYQQSANYIIDNNNEIDLTISMIIAQYIPLNYEDVQLCLLSYENQGVSDPYYIFLVMLKGKEIGRIVFRLGDETTHLYAGHVGYTIHQEYRGKGYAYQATKALIPFMRHLGYSEILITCSPQNIASKKTIEKLGAIYEQALVVPARLKKQFNDDEKEKLIYRLKLHNSQK